MADEREERDDDLDEEREEGRRTEAPTGEGHVDSEPESEVIPHSAKAYSDYHTGLKDLTHAAAHHHGEFLKEMKKHHGAMEHMTLKNHFGRMLEDHEKSLNDMLDSHNHILDQVKRKFAKYHPDLEPLDKDLDEEDDLPTGDKPTKEPRQSRSDRGELGHEDTKSLPKKDDTAHVGAGHSVQSEHPHEFSAAGRREEAESGVAMRDGSFPIRTKQDLTNAIHAIGRAKNPEAAKSHIRKRASALGLEHLIPEHWGKADPPMETKAIEGDDLTEAEAAVLLQYVGQIRKEAKDLRREIEKSVG